jgi:hypothetical protein
MESRALIHLRKKSEGDADGEGQRYDDALKFHFPNVPLVKMTMTTMLQPKNRRTTLVRKVRSESVRLTSGDRLSWTAC